jgi:superfamily II DNA or RNA helicase
MLTHNGYVTRHWTVEHKKELTVRPLAPSPDFPRPKGFKIFRTCDGSICVPRYFGQSVFGQRVPDVRRDPSPAQIVAVGSLRTETRQDEAFTKATESMESIGGAVISLPCGFGKTRVALEIASHFKVRTAVLVHKEFLAEQWRQAIKQFCPGASIGLIQGDSCDTEKDFVIVMIQTLSQRAWPKGLFNPIGLVIVDECHHICARVFSQSMFALCPKYSLGLSATPDRKDGLTEVMYWFLGPNVLTVTRKSSHVQVVTIPFHGPFPQVTINRAGKVSLPEMITDLTKIPERNEALLSLIRRVTEEDSQRHILVLSDRREHVFFIKEHLDQMCISAGVYIGGMKQCDLEESARKRVILGTFSLAQEGLDIPTLDTAIFATPKSDIVQAAGRILRKSHGEPIIYDIVDHWSVFHGMFYKRLRQYRGMEFSITLEGDEGHSDHKEQYKVYRFDD